VTGTDLASAAPAALPDRPPGALARGTLGRRLAVRVVALVALVAVLLSVASAFTAYRVMINQVDQQLTAATGRIRSDPRGDDDRGPRPGDSLLLPGMPIGTVIYARTDRQAAAGILIEGGTQRLTDHQVTELEEASLQDGTRSALLADLGRYRLRTLTTDGKTLVVALPLAQVDRAMILMLRAAAVLTLFVLAVAILVVRAVVVRNLRPLNRLAATATQVSRMELERGDVDLGVRVAEQDADPASEVGRVGQAFNFMLANVEDALATRHASETKVRQFVADASHELRNPLASIRGYAELTRRNRADLPPDTQFAMSRIESESERMSRLVEDLLLLARLDSDPRLNLRPTDVTEVVVNAVSDARAAGPEHRWVFDLAPEPVEAKADPHRLHQVVANLLANARTHTPAGTTVTARVRREDTWAIIEVADDGPGIPPDIVDRVFERFARGDASRVRKTSTGSTGLGLAIVAAVVDAHHGTVQVNSSEQGTTFTVRIPAVSA